MPNRLKQILYNRIPAVGTWIGCLDPYYVESIADIGFDWLLIDMEHFPLSDANLRTIVMACKGSISVPVVRVSSNARDRIQAALDLGAQGVMVPMVNSPADAEHAVQLSRYPPEGRRGFGPVRAGRYGQNAVAYRKSANDETLLFVQVETPEAAQNAKEILQVPGIDGVFIGNGDLASFLNNGEAGSASVQELVDDLIKLAAEISLPVGLPTWSPAEYCHYAEKGAQLLTIGSDMVFAATGAREALSGSRELLTKFNLPSS